MRARVKAFVFVALCMASVAVLAQGCPGAWEWLNPRPHGDNLYGASWSDGLFVAVGGAGRIQTSVDGTTWAYPASVTPESLLGVCQGNGRWVAVGVNGVILESPNGATWEAVASGTSALLRALVFTGSQFVAVGWGGAVLTSPDGLVWTARCSGTTADLHGLAWGGGLLVAVGDGGTAVTSLDGHNWTPYSISGEVPLRACVYGGAFFLAASQNGTILKSPDGAIWEDMGRPFGTWTTTGLLWDGSTFFAYGVNFVAVSADGSQWAVQPGLASVDVYAIAWNGATYVAAGAGGTLLVSTDAVSWSALTQGETGQILAIAHGAPGFAAAGLGFILMSPDGTNWQEVWNLNGNGIGSVAYGNGLFVAVADARTVFTSTDGRSWRVRRVSPGPGWLTGVAFGKGRFVAVGDGGLILTSRDGVQWIKRRAATHRRGLAKVAWSGSRFVAVGYKGVVLTSADGITWRSRHTGISADLADVSYGALGFIAVGGSLILTSADGSSWTAIAKGTGSYPGFLAVAQGNGVAMVAGTGPPLVSHDGVNWLPTSVPTENVIRALVFHQDAFYAAGDEGNILRSACLPGLP